MTETTATDNIPTPDVRATAFHREILGEFLDEIKENGIQFEILAAVPDPSGLVLKLEFPTQGSKSEAAELIKAIAEGYQQFTWEVSGPVGPTILQVLMKLHEGASVPDPDPEDSKSPAPKEPYKDLYEEIREKLKDSGMEIESIFYNEERLNLKLSFKTTMGKREGKYLIRELLINHPELFWEFDDAVSGRVFTFTATSKRETEPVKGIPFSSPEESSGEDAKAYAIRLVREQLASEFKTAKSIYIVWFSHILGNWKALVSTSLEDGQYYEVTHNKNKDETYVDTYVKTRNEVHRTH